MEQKQQNQIIVGVVFGVLVIVPLIIGLSVYNRPDPAPVFVKPLVPSLPPIPPEPPRVQTQYRYYVSGYAYDQNSGKVISNGVLTTESGGTSLGENGYFTMPISTSTTSMTLSLAGYESRVFYLAADGPNLPFTQELGSVMFTPLQSSISVPVEVYAQKDPQDNLNKLFYTDRTTKAQVKLNDDNVLNFKQSPDLQKVVYAYKDNVDGKMGVYAIEVSQPLLKSGISYIDLKPNTKLSIIGWTKDSCCAVWVSENVQVSKTGGWGTVLAYYNFATHTLSYILNPATGQHLFEKVVKTEFSPTVDFFAAEYEFKYATGETYNGLLVEDLKTGVLTGVQVSNQISTLKGFFFDKENRLNYWLYYPASENQKDLWLRWNPLTSATDTYYSKPAFWNDYK